MAAASLLLFWTSAALKKYDKCQNDPTGKCFEFNTDGEAEASLDPAVLPQLKGPSRGWSEPAAETAAETSVLERGASANLTANLSKSREHEKSASRGEQRLNGTRSEAWSQSRSELRTQRGALWSLLDRVGLARPPTEGWSVVLDIRWLSLGVLALVVLLSAAAYGFARRDQPAYEEDAVPQSARYTQRRFDDAMIERRDKTFRCRREGSEPFLGSEAGTPSSHNNALHPRASIALRTTQSRGPVIADGSTDGAEKRLSALTPR